MRNFTWATKKTLITFHIIPIYLGSIIPYITPLTRVFFIAHMHSLGLPLSKPHLAILGVLLPPSWKTIACEIGLFWDPLPIGVKPYPCESEVNKPPPWWQVPLKYYSWLRFPGSLWLWSITNIQKKTCSNNNPKKCRILLHFPHGFLPEGGFCWTDQWTGGFEGFQRNT